MASARCRRHPLIWVPSLLIADDAAAVPADPAIAGTAVHATGPREAPDTLIVPRDTRCRGLAAGNALLMSHEHRSPIR